MFNLTIEWLEKYIVPKSLIPITLATAITLMAGCSTMDAKPAKSVAKFSQESLEALGDNDAAVKVKITPELSSINIAGVNIKRNQNQQNTINVAFQQTSRQCPPFCIRPWSIAPGVDTVAELEVLYYAKLAADGDDSILIVDARTPDWAKRGTIPSSINIPFTHLVTAKGANEITIGEALETFGAVEQDEGWDFSHAKTLILFCNGMWCGQSPLAISALRKMDYPASKLKYYRGGMQSWETLGLPTVKP